MALSEIFLRDYPCFVSPIMIFFQGTSRMKLYDEPETLSDLRSFNRIIFKLNKQSHRACLREKLPPLLIEDVPNANLNILYEKRDRRGRYKKSFFPDAICSWNNILGNSQGNITHSSLRSPTLVLIRPKPTSLRPKPTCFYDIHDPIVLRYLFRLRTVVSPSRSHKYHHNIFDIPADHCSCHQGIECLLFAKHRSTLAVIITTILLRHILTLNLTYILYIYVHIILQTTATLAVNIILQNMQTMLNFIFMVTQITHLVIIKKS